VTDHLAYVRPGVSADGLVNSAERYNLLTDAARMARTSREGFRADNAPVPLGENEFRVKNDTGADRDRFDIVAFEDPVYLRDDNLYAFADRQQTLLSAIEPAWPDHFLSWGVLQEPCREGKIARVRVGGVAVALVNFANSAAQTWHKHATIIDATYGRLESTFAGSARILWRDTTAVDSTRYWCKLLLNSPFDSELFGVLDGSLSQGGSATMSVHRHDGSSWSDTTANVTVYDRLLKSGATAISSGKWVVARFYSGRWWVTSAECN
jgi:hypothetical protein